MQTDLNRFRRRRRRRRQLMAVIAIALLGALLVVLMRSCADRFHGPYNKGYQPMDQDRQMQQQEGPH
ncbi:MAG TPA: hypothetical protein VNH42_02830 [Mariprofundaceae bacterium]|nr:hypothetical protein [Mariprofundaceae bacterium]